MAFPASAVVSTRNKGQTLPYEKSQGLRKVINCSATQSLQEKKNRNRGTRWRWLWSLNCRAAGKRKIVQPTERLRECNNKRETREWRSERDREIGI